MVDLAYAYCACIYNVVERVSQPMILYYYYIDRQFNNYTIFCVVLFHVQHYCPAYTDLESEITGRWQISYQVQK